MKQYFLSLLAVIVAPGLLAQGTAFTYQGRLENNGNPASGNYDFTFSLFSNNTTNSGQLSATLTTNNVGVTDGLFTVTLDFGNQFAGAARWLEIGARTNGAAVFATMAPLQPVLPTPYAVYAEAANATNLVGTIPVTSLSGAARLNGGNAFTGAQSITGGSVGIGTTTPSTTLQVKGAVTATNFVGPGAGLTGLNPTNLVAGTAGISITGNAATATTATTAATATTATTANSVAAPNITGVILNGSLPVSPTFAGTVTATNFVGPGLGLTKLNPTNLSAGTAGISITGNAATATTATAANSVAAGHITGTLTLGQLPASVLTNGARGVNISGAFSGSVSATSLQLAPLTVVSTTNFTTNGTYTFTVPPSITSMIVKLWGAGGGSGGYSPAGGGAFSQVSLDVTPRDTYVVVVGQGGGPDGQAGGGAGSNDGAGGSGFEDIGGGGQASSLFRYSGSTYIMQAVAGGGSGGSDVINGAGGQAGGSGLGYAPEATTTGVTNLDLIGGDGQTPPNPGTGGGGGGYGGGLSTGVPAEIVSGGGSYGDTLVAGNLIIPANTNDPSYLAGSGVGGYTGFPGVVGGDGLAVVFFGTGGGLDINTLEATGRVGIGTATPQQKLDVNGNINASGDVTAAGFSGALSGSVSATSLRVAHLTVVSTTDFATNGTYTFTAPPAVTSMIVKLWGAGGAGGWLTDGGGGAFAQVALNVNPGDTYVMVVGQGGQGPPLLAGGGSEANDGSGGLGVEDGFPVYSTGGGQASSLFHQVGANFIMQAVAGGGSGGSGEAPGAGGQASGSGSGYAATATTTGVTNLDLIGGNGQNAPDYTTGGGGGGYGGGASQGSGGAVFGGGSYGDATFGGTSTQPGNTSDANYLAGSGFGGYGLSDSAGADGLGVVLFGTGGVNGNINAGGAITAAAFSGDGSGLTDLNAADLTGALPAISGANLTALPPNAALLDADQTFTGENTFSAVANLNGGISMNTATGYHQSSLGPMDVDSPGVVGGRLTVTTGGNVGIGTTSPAAKLQVAGSGFFGSDSGSLASSAGTGIRVFIDGASGSGSIFAYNYGNFSPTNLLLQQPGGKVGIGTSSPDALLSVNGTADKPGGGSWTTFSDARLKDVGADFTHGMEALAALQPIHYHYKTANPLRLPSQPDYIGLVAQQVQAVIPEAVQQNQDGYLTVNNDPIIWTMLNAIKELNQKYEAAARGKDAEIAALKAKADLVDSLAKQNDLLAARLNELEATVKTLAIRK